MGKTAKDFVNHWEWAAEKGLMNTNSANALRASCTKVLEVEKEWEEIDVTSLDVDTLLKRFVNLKGKDYKPDSLKEYERRFRKAYASYLSYLHDPSSWKISGAERPPRTGNADRSRKLAKPPTGQAGEPEPFLTTAGFVEYPFPLRQDRIVRMVLPVDLKIVEVRRLTAFLTTLAVDGDLAEA